MKEDLVVRQKLSKVMMVVCILAAGEAQAEVLSKLEELMLVVLEAMEDQMK
jgi:hypothetical protein